MKQVIEGLEEGLQAIAEALEGGGGSGSIVPTPTLADEGKVLQVIPQTESKVAPEWAEINQVPIGGTQGQVLTKGESGYNWANPSGGGGSTITKESVGATLSGISIDDTSYTNAAVVTVPGSHLSASLLSALSGNDILSIRLLGGDDDFSYLVDCIGWYLDDKSNDLYIYYRKADMVMLSSRQWFYFYYYA